MERSEKSKVKRENKGKMLERESRMCVSHGMEWMVKGEKEFHAVTSPLS